MLKIAFSPDKSRYSNFYFFNSTSFNFFHQGVNIDIFLPEMGSSFLNILKDDFYTNNYKGADNTSQITPVKNYSSQSRYRV